MKLQKLTYFAHGLSLAENQPLVNELPEVWKFGPVYRSLYIQLKYHGGTPINTVEAEIINGIAPRVDDEDFISCGFIERVWEKFSRYTAVQLSDLTHQNGTPWFVTARNYQWMVPRGTDIPQETMRQYFQAHGLNG